MKNYFSNIVLCLLIVLVQLCSPPILHAQRNNMGIGTTSPNVNAILDIESNTKGMLIPRLDQTQENGLSGPNGLLIYNSTKNRFNYYNGGWKPVGLWSINGSKVYYNTDNVGIGTSNPLSKLGVAGGIAVGATYSGSNTAPTNGAIIEGNVGIGNNNPGSKLDVAGNIRTNSGLVINHSYPTLTLQDTDNRSGFIHVNDGLMYFLNSTSNNSTTWAANGSYWPLHLNLTTDAATFGGPAYFMEGNVGVGTTGPLTSLSITPNDVAPKITLWDGGDASNHYGFGVSGSQLNYHTGADHVFYAGGKNGNGTELMRISGNGTVKIGDAVNYSNQWLKVKAPNGSNNAAVFSNNSPADGAGVSYPTLALSNDSGTGLALFISAGTAAKPGGGSWGAASDLRLKKDISGYTDGLESVRQIRPVWYRYNGLGGLPTQPRYVGVIAQELQRVAPQMVSNTAARENTENYLMVDPSDFTYMLINSVKELDETVQEQQAIIESQKQKIDSQQIEIDNIKRALEKAGIKLD